MRQYIIASHAHFATGIKESVELLSGARDNVHDLSMFVDVQTRPRTYLVTNMNLPLLIQLLFSDESAPVEETIRAIVAADDTRVKFVNDLLVDDDEEEEF